MLAGGLRAALCCVDSQQLDASFAGRDFDAALLDALPAGVDPCGENGEFHTCVSDGPMFTAALALECGHLFDLPTTGLRFFTVYGPWGRPDMALFLFTRNILAGKPIDVFNHGHHTRDFTYVDDIVEGVIRTLDRVRSEEHTSELQSIMRISYAVFCLKKKNNNNI